MTTVKRPNIRLAGFNIDLYTLEKIISTIEQDQRKTLTPEVISAAYARISRSSKSIAQLRQEAAADVVKARKSNSKIVFDMGHASIAEHAVLNFDIEGISRLATEFLESSRLASFTERSQRYVKLHEDFVLPEELFNTSDMGLYLKQVHALFDTYADLYKQLSLYWTRKGLKRTKAEERAKEDARYVLPLATTTQLGMTVNARSLERILVRLRSHTIAELQLIAQQLEHAAKEVIPSLVRYAVPEEADMLANGVIDWSACSKSPDPKSDVVAPDARLVAHSPDIAETIVAALEFANAQGNFSECMARACSNADKTGARINSCFETASPYWKPPRAFEFAWFVFEVECSASCFAQLKRHRMASLIPGPYMMELGVQLPPAFVEAGVKKNAIACLQTSTILFSTFASRYGWAAAYLLTNAHRRRVLVGMNLRELFHFCRLRLDQHAQWEIRQLARKLRALVTHQVPFVSKYLEGKDKFLQAD